MTGIHFPEDHRPHAPQMGLTPDALLTTTRAVRRRLDFDRPVARGLIEECLQLAFQAPNACNVQPWTWIVIDDPALRQKVADIYRAAAADYMDAMGKEGQKAELSRIGWQADFSNSAGQRMAQSSLHLSEHLHEAPMLVIPTVSCRLEQASLFEHATVWGSIFPALWSFMLALRSRGLGSSLTTCHLRREREMADLLGIPHANATQVALLPVAYTKGTDFKPGDRTASRDAVHWNAWSADSSIAAS